MSRILKTRFSLWAIVSILMGLNVVSCATNGTGNKQTIGAVSGAVVGGLLGTQIGSGSGKILATAAGAAVGAFAGSEIGKLDFPQKSRHGQAQILNVCFSYSTGQRYPRVECLLSRL
jgi:outer membrane lipoprotein SlyB